MYWYEHSNGETVVAVAYLWLGVSRSAEGTLGDQGLKAEGLCLNWSCLRS